MPEQTPGSKTFGLAMSETRGPVLVFDSYEMVREALLGGIPGFQSAFDLSFSSFFLRESARRNLERLRSS